MSSQNTEKTLFDPTNQAREAGAAAIDEPIINRPYEEPQCHWRIVTDWDTPEQGAPEKVAGRREAGYFFAPRTGRGAASVLEEVFVPLEHVNEIRSRVGQWRAEGYRGVTPVTRRLLEHWRSPEREPPLFFCQVEAAETIIWLHEAHPADRQGLFFTDPETGERTPLDQAHPQFLRYCCKMATGTGKTVVMAMVIAWSVLNKLHYPQQTWCSDAVLLVAPGVTVKDRLSVLVPSNEDSYYNKFELVPPSLKAMLGQGKVCILHRQELALRDDTKTRSVVKLGSESDTALANRLLKRDLGSKQRLLVINDEGHHCYRPVENESAQRDLDFGNGSKTEAKEENKRAAQWITGLEKIHSARGILTCLDFSATPFYIKGSGYPEGRPFPWVVSDFGLVDAIESGLVKIPQIPVDSNHGDGKSPPAYFHLWRWINDRLPPEERESARRKGKPEAIVQAADPALVTMIGNWTTVFKEWSAQSSPVPPVMIAVCQNTDISRLVFERMTEASFEFTDFVNNDSQEVTFLYDSKELAKAEEGESAKESEQRKREVMNTVGKEGLAGAGTRCIVSVSMLTEGWDANNVTQIIGLRAFTSQLLCEQVVGRALRRRSYDVDENGFLSPEYADVYGVPFQVIPVRARAAGVVTQKPTTLVQALKERSHLELRFPRVEGYVTEVTERVVCDWDSVPELQVGAGSEPTEVLVKGAVGVRIGRPDRGGPGRLEVQNRMPYYLLTRVQSVTFAIAAELAKQHVPGSTDADAARRQRLFPQFLEIVRAYVGSHIIFTEAPQEEIGLANWRAKIVSVLGPNIHDAGESGEPRIVPRIERFRPEGSTREVFFRTARVCCETMRSHISHVVLDSASWEKSATYKLEASPAVDCYARNDHLDFTIPFVDAYGNPHNHRPDFVVRLKSGLLVALEIKGHVRELDEIKIKAGEKWAKAVNRYFGERRWGYHVCFDPSLLDSQLAALNG